MKKLKHLEKIGNTKLKHIEKYLYVNKTQTFNI
jgi:hypothetical protein